MTAANKRSYLELERLVLQALGIDSHDVSSLRLTFTGGELPRVEVEYSLWDSDIDDFITELKTFTLTPIDTDL
jgi:hypothetical protein